MLKTIWKKNIEHGDQEMQSNFPSNGWLVSLFNGISTSEGYLMPKLFSQKNSSGNI